MWGRKNIYKHYFLTTQHQLTWQYVVRKVATGGYIRAVESQFFLFVSYFPFNDYFQNRFNRVLSLIFQWFAALDSFLCNHINIPTCVFLPVRYFDVFLKNYFLLFYNYGVLLCSLPFNSVGKTNSNIVLWQLIPPHYD